MLMIADVMKVEDQRAENQRITRCLDQIKRENFKFDWYCGEFVRRNRNWLLDNMRSILTPSTIYKNRKSLMTKLQVINGDLQYHKELNSQKKKLDSSKKVLDFNEKEEIRKSLKPSFFKIMKLWHKRASTMMVYRSQVAGIMERACLPYCEFCWRNWGLKCESIDNIEVVFHNFLEKCHSEGKNYSSKSWKADEWQEFFENNVVFRTSCYKCYERLIPEPVDRLDRFLSI